MNRVEIYTNNPDVRDAFAGMIRFEAQDVRGVFIAIRDAVHQGARVLSHPLSGSVKPWESPYKSIAVSVERGPLDFTSLQIIEDAITKLRASGVNVEKAAAPPCSLLHRYDESVLADFRIIDFELISSALEGITCMTFSS